MTKPIENVHTQKSISMFLFHRSSKGESLCGNSQKRLESQKVSQNRT